MRGANRYILGQIAGPMLFITLAGSGVLWLTESLRIIDRSINDGLPAGTLLYLTALVMPSVLAIVLPLALFCALVYGYNRLATESELVVLWAAGISTRQLARPALLLALAVTAICYGLMLYLMPLGFRTLKDLQWDFRSDLANVLLQEGTFNTLAPGLTVYFRERQSDGVLRDILVHDSRVPDKPVTMMAERGMLVRTPEGPRFVMRNGNRQQVEVDRRQLSLLYFDDYTLDLNQYAGPHLTRWLDASERFLPELLWPNNSADDQAYYWKLVVEGHRRLTTPLYVMALTLIALAAILAGEFNRRGQHRRILAAAGIATAVQLMALGIANLAVKFPPLIPLLYIIPIALCLAAGYVLERGRPRRAAAAPALAGAA
ncbi:MAG TPA: LPS export ABC transporter permease LptF [Candidatus Sulfotelmatobacter sp.]|nr:LPS export ABC transporter permease LptF [Candidatus Sulfotelmatobacter sp.]